MRKKILHYLDGKIETVKPTLMNLHSPKAVEYCGFIFLLVDEDDKVAHYIQVIPKSIHPFDIEG